MSSVRICTSEGETLHRIERCEPGMSSGDAKLFLRNLDGPEQTTSWRRWVWVQDKPAKNGKRLTAAICLPLDEQNASVPHDKDKDIPFHVFFPTEEASGVRALIHASFELEQNRKHVRGGEHDAVIIETFSELFEKMLKDDSVSARTVLEAFGKVKSDAEGEDDEKPLHKLSQKIWDTLCEAPFVPVIGGERVKPADARLWEDRLGFVLRDDAQEVQNARLLVPALRDLKNILEGFGAKGIESKVYIRLLLHCRNDSLKECLVSWCVLMKRMSKMDSLPEKELRNIPCWWIEKSGEESARALEGDLPLLRARPKNWPAWLPADALHPRMNKAWMRWEKKLGSTSAKPVQTRLLWGNKQFLDKALLPYVAEWDDERWDADGWKALGQISFWWNSRSKFGDIPPYVPYVEDEGDKERAEIAKKLRLPTDKGWLPAADCYAGEAWGGPPSFDEFFAKAEKRGLVLPFSEWRDCIPKEKKEDEWKSLLRWAGVSWEPKVRSVKCPPCAHDLVSEYKEGYGNSVRSRHSYGIDYWKRDRWKYNWVVEYFPQCVQGAYDDRKPWSIIRMMLPLVKAAKKYKALYKYHSLHKWKSFASYQLRHEKWLPCEPGLLHHERRVAPSTAFLPRKGLSRMFPEVDKRCIGDEEWDQGIEKELSKAGVQRELPDEPAEWHKWMRKLSDLRKQLSESDKDAPGSLEDGRLWKAADALYRGYLKIDGDKGFPEDIHVPCRSWNNDREVLAFSPPEHAYYVDAPDLEEVKREIVKKYDLFIISLDAGAKAPERLGVQPLSAHLKAKPLFDFVISGETEKLLERYLERCQGLSLAAKLKNPLPEELSLAAVRGLRLELTGNGENVASVHVFSWKPEERELLVNLDKGKGGWKALAHGLARWVAKKKEAKSLFELLLGEDDKEEYLDRLREEGVTEEDIEAASEKFRVNGVGGGNSTSGGQQTQEYRDIQEEDRNGGTVFNNKGDQGEREVVDPPPGPMHDGGNQRETYAHDSGGGGSEGVKSGSLSPETRDDNSGRGGRTQGPNPETGRTAEDWFEEILQGKFPQCRRGERDDGNRESDFVIPGDAEIPMEIHIEVKHAKSGPWTFYWSGGQCEKARDLERSSDKKYIMAILSPDGEKNYEIRWIWRPLDQLKDMKRNVQWKGDINYELCKGKDWEVTGPDEVPVKGHIFRITLNDAMRENLPQDTEALDRLGEKISEWCPRPDSNRHGVAPTSPSS